MTTRSVVPSAPAAVPVRTVSAAAPVGAAAVPVGAAATRRQARDLERALVAARRPRPRIAAGTASLRSAGTRLVTAAAMGFVALLTIGMSIPASAFGSPDAQALGVVTAAGVRGAQTFSVSGSVASGAVGRDGYEMTSRATYEARARAAAEAEAAAQRAAQLAALAATVKRGGAGLGVGPVRWAVPVMVGLGPGFGAPSTCRGCQPIHQGQDFLSADGSPVAAIAAGVVTQYDESGTLGVHVTISHRIAGHTVTSTYAHLQTASVPVSVGDKVAVGQLVGLTGATGAATGPHLHLEIAVDGVKVDPYAWLLANVRAR